MIVGVLAWAYVEHGDTRVVQDVFAGVVPVVLAIILWSLVPMLRTAAKTWWLVGRGSGGAGDVPPGVNELLVLLGGALLGLVPYVVGRSRAGSLALLLPLVLAPGSDGHGSDGRLETLFLTFLKIGAVLYGSGYVLLAFLRNDFVERLGWLTNEQLLDAVAIGQLTPGPVFTTATFVGYIVGGVPGALVATLGIFLPSFFFVGLLTRVVGWLRSRGWTSAAARRPQRHRAVAHGRDLLDAGTGRAGRRLDGGAVRSIARSSTTDVRDYRRARLARARRSPQVLSSARLRWRDDWRARVASQAESAWVAVIYSKRGQSPKP